MAVPKEGVELERYAHRTFDRLHRSVIEFWITYLTLLFFGGALEAVRAATDSWWATGAYWVNSCVITIFLVNRLGLNGPCVRTKRAKDMAEVDLGLSLNLIFATPFIWFYGMAARELGELVARTTPVN